MTRVRVVMDCPNETCVNGIVAVECPTCRGSGEGMRDGWNCSQCRGKCSVYLSCDECDGEGVVDAPDGGDV